MVTMLNSMRAQLTIWYTGVLALVLVVFAFVTYSYLARAARERTDQSLADTANALISNFTAEADDEGQSDTDAASEVTRNFQFKDRQVIIFDGKDTVIAASDPPTEISKRHPWPALTTLSQSLSQLLLSTGRPDGGRA